MIVVFDLDGTLANIDHRLHHIYKKPKDWDSFFKDIHLDLPKKPIVDLCQALRTGGHVIYIFSGRSDICKAETVNWLLDNGIDYDMLMMRKAGDRRDDVEVKKDMLNILRAIENTEPDLVIEDRQRVVDFWRSEGLTCLQCAQWEEFKEIA